MRKKTNEKFKQEVKEKVGDEYTVLGEYKTNKTKILMRHNCDKCNNYEWETTPHNFLDVGRRCPICAGNYKKDINWFKQEVKEKVGNEYTVLGNNYINNHSKILMRHNCDKCNNYEWEITSADFLNKNCRCPYCSNSIPLDTELFKEKIYRLVGNEYTLLSDIVNNNHDKILIRHNCDKCNNYEFKMRPKNFMQGNRCPYCAKHEAESRAIKYIKKYLNDKNILFEDEKLYDGMKYIEELKIDIFTNNINIEFDGKQHFYGWHKDKENKELIQKRDKVKNDYCLNNNLHLIRIPYKEEQNLNLILDAIINYNENLLIEHNCLIIKNGEIINKPNTYSWYN